MADVIKTTHIMAHKREYIQSNTPTVNNAVSMIKSNYPTAKLIESRRGETETVFPTVSYRWYVVKNKKGHLIEVGGRANVDGLIEIKAYIPRYNKSGFPIFYPLNDFVDHDYSIEFNEEHLDCMIEYPTQNVCNIKKFKTLKQFISFIDNKEWPTDKILVDQRVAYTETIYENYISKF